MNVVNNESRNKLGKKFYQMGKYFLALKEKGVRARVFLTPANSNLPRRPVSAALTVNKTKILKQTFLG